MKRALTAILILMSLSCMLFASASGEQSLTFRTGPGAQYSELFTLPVSDGMSNKGIETVDGVEWMLVEFTHDGKLQRAYAEVGNRDVSRDLPSPTVDCISCFANANLTVLAAPSNDAAARGTVKKHRMINYLSSITSSDGQFYDFIEFFDQDAQALSRGYIPADASSYTSDAGAYMRSATPVYGEPSYSSDTVGKVGELEIVGLREQLGSFAQIQFYSGAKGDRMFGYVPTDLVVSPYIQ